MDSYLDSYFEKHKKQIIEDYTKLLSFQSISAEPGYLDECKACASWIEKQLKAIGFATSQWGEGFPPTVFGTYQGDPNSPTLLIYNHYDVQPVDPIDLWENDPFTATITGDKIVARGAQDNKGQFFYILTALRALYEKHKGYPGSIKVLIEGEEESGSANLAHLLTQHKKEIKADYAMIVDLGMRNPAKPAITIGTRGLLGMTVELTGTREDLHSGVHGGLAFNPLHALIEILAKARNANGSIAIPGFYNGLEEPSDELLKSIASDFDPNEYAKKHGSLPTGGEKHLSHVQRNWLRPTFEVNGVHGGYGGPGSKTVIPSMAFAKITCRLVPGQDPQFVASKIREFIEKNSPEGITPKVTLHEGLGIAVRTDPSSLCIQALSKAMKEVYKTDAEFILEGASIPIVPDLAKATHADVVMWGLGLSTDRIHAPNEEFDFSRMNNGFKVAFRTIEILNNKGGV